MAAALFKMCLINHRSNLDTANLQRNMKLYDTVRALGRNCFIVATYRYSDLDAQFGRFTYCWTLWN